MTSLSEAGVLHWAEVGTKRLAEHEAQLNALNVFPVADHDTGTNMVATMRAGLAAAHDAEQSSWMSAFSQGMFTGARGNSGAILTQFWRAVLQNSWRGLSAPDFGNALGRATAYVETAVGEPVEGTALTVLRFAAAAAKEHDDAGERDLGHLALAVADAAAQALARTPEQLVTLAEAQVVDAGGFGIVCLLDALVEVVTGVVPERPAFLVGAPAEAPRRTKLPTVQQYEVELEFPEVTETRAVELRERLTALGDSVVVAGDGSGRLAVHVHTPDAGAAVLAGIAAGQVVAVRITALPAPVPQTSRAVLALVAGAGLARLFRDAGAHVLEAGGQISAEELARAVRDLAVGEVFVLPNGALGHPELIRAAAAIRSEGLGARFLPCAAPVQGLAAIAVHDPQRPAADDEFSMVTAAAGARWASLTVAHEEAFTWAGRCLAGDFLGVVGEEVVLVAHERQQACANLVDLLLAAGGELVTVLVGELGDAFVAQSLEEHVRRRHPGVELVVFEGAQPDQVVQVGVE